MANCLVIGGNGFLGSHVVDALAGAGHRVAAFDRFGMHPVQFADHRVEIIAGDFLNVGDIRAALVDREIVLHFLSTTDPATSEGDPRLDIRTNLASSVDLFEACADAGVSCVYFASTGGAIYGDQVRTVFRETDLAEPVSPYAIGKQAIEGYLRYFRRKRGLESVSFRISNPYGPRQDPTKRQGVIPIFLRQLALGRPLTVFGDGSMVRDYLYVEDMAEMIAQIVSTGTRHHLYNLGSGVGTSLDELIQHMAAATGLVPEIQLEPRPPTFVDHVTLDTHRYVAEFGPRTMTGLTDGIRRTWLEMRSHLGNGSPEAVIPS